MQSNRQLSKHSKRRGFKKNTSEASHGAQQALQFIEDWRELHRIARERIGKQYISMQSNRQRSKHPKRKGLNKKPERSEP